MKALSIQQPWAWLIVNGYKRIENRSWRTSFRGPVLIHAGKTVDKEGIQYVTRECGFTLPQLDRGGIVGKGIITDCVSQSDSFWFVGPYGFVLEDPQPLPFVPLRGQLGFFEVSQVQS